MRRPPVPRGPDRTVGGAGSAHLGSRPVDCPAHPTARNRPREVSPLPDTDLDDLVVAAQSGDATAFGELFRHLAPAVTAYLSRRGATTAQDLTSEVFLGVFRQIDRFHGDATQLRTFVFSVAHHRLVDQVRQRSRRPPEILHPAVDDLAHHRQRRDTALDQLGDQRIRTLLRGLPADQYAVLLLRVVADLTCTQIARSSARPRGRLSRRSGARWRRCAPNSPRKCTQMNALDDNEYVRRTTDDDTFEALLDGQTPAAQAPQWMLTVVMNCDAR